MKRIKAFLIYFPVTLVAVQVLINLVYFIDKDFYISNGFYLGTLFGTNAYVALYFLLFTFTFKFCSVSRLAAVAECLFALYYLVIQKDDVYNIVFQITVGILALIATSITFTKKYPLCKFSLFWRFVWNATAKGSCAKGLEKWENDTKALIVEKHFNK